MAIALREAGGWLRRAVVGDHDLELLAFERLPAESLD
jgi:hypothetical protein